MMNLIQRLLAATPLAGLFGTKDPGHIDQLVGLLRQAVGLLKAGRAPRLIWEELAEHYPPCTGSEPAPDDLDPGCCLHHVLIQQRSLRMLGRTPLTQVRSGPGQPHYWDQIAGCLRIAEHTGMPLATLLERLADAWEAGEDAHQARQTAAAGPMSTAKLLMLLPLGGIGLSMMLGTTIFDLLGTVFGWLLLFAGILFAAVGRLWIRRLMAEAEHV